MHVMSHSSDLTSTFLYHNPAANTNFLHRRTDMAAPMTADTLLRRPLYGLSNHQALPKFR